MIVCLAIVPARSYAATTEIKAVEVAPEAKEPVVEAQAEDDGGLAKDKAFRARVDLSHTLSDDTRTPVHVSFSDLRLTLDAVEIFDTALELHLDGRGRRSWNSLTDDRLDLRQAYVRYGGEKDSLRVSAGRQLVRSVGSAAVDGLRVDYRLWEDTFATVFGGLMPHPFDGTLDTKFITAGAGYDRRNEDGTHAGGLVASLFDGGLDRIYLTQRSFFVLSPELIASAFGIVDLAAPEPLLGLGGDGGLDLSSFNGMLRYRPARWLDTNLSLTHNHTIIPNKWWINWLNEKRRAMGFVLDGNDPLGTRISSVRWTNNLSLTPQMVPYFRLRYDRRHTQSADGYEARVGFKWRPTFGYADFHYSFRRYFNSETHLAGVRVGLDGRFWGADIGTTAMRAKPLNGGKLSTVTDVYLLGWFDLRALSDGLEGAQLVGQYQTFIQPDGTYHTLFMQLGYRI